MSSGSNSSSNSSRPSTGSHRKDKPNPLIQQDFELTEEQRKCIEAGYVVCEKDIQGKVRAGDAREALIKLWVEQDHREEQSVPWDHNQGQQNQGQQNQGQQNQGEESQEQQSQLQQSQGQQSQEQQSQGQKNQEQGRNSRTQSRATSRAGQKQGDERDEQRLKAIQSEVDGIMRRVEEAAYRAIHGIQEVDNIMKKVKLELSKDQFMEAAGTMFWVRAAHNILCLLFKVFDIDGDGYIEASDLCRVMEEVNNPLKPDELRGMMEAADHDRDGKITFEEFKEMMLTPS